MKIQMAIMFGILVLCLGACAPAAPAQETGSAGTEPTQTSAAIGEGPTSSPAPPAETIPVGETAVVETAVIETEEETPTETPAATLTEWEQVQQTIETYLNRLDRSSDGYLGLTTALEQAEPNQTWCGGLNAAIGDFSYVNDEESAQALRDLQEAQGCQ